MASHGINSSSFLFDACERGDLVLIQKHVHSLSPTNIAAIRDEHKASLVHYACRYGHLNILDYLIRQKHLDISQIRTDHGATCAHDAAVCDRVDILDYIFHHHHHTDGQNPSQYQKLRWNVRDDQGNSPLHLAANYGSISVLHYLLDKERADPHIQSYNGSQPLHCASASGQIECVKILLNAAADTVNAQTSALLTPLYLACQHGSLDIMKILLSHGANLKIKDENGLNCLHAACQNSQLDIVQWLIEKHNANVNDIDYLNNTPLHYAATNGNEAIIAYLIEKNARIMAAANGNTPLHVAAENGQRNACALLIETGSCSVTTMNSQRLTPADLADRAGYPALANELRLRADVHSPISSSSSSQTTVNGIPLGKTSVIRLVVKKKNVPRSDASNQVAEEELMPMNQSNSKQFSSTKKLTNQRFDLSELRARVQEHDSRRDTINNRNGIDNVLEHSLDSINRQQQRNHQRPKLPAQVYGPWLKMGNMSPEAFHQEIQTAQAGLRKVRRDSLTASREEFNSNQRRSRSSLSIGRSILPSESDENIDQLSRNSSQEFLKDRNNLSYKKYRTPPRPTVIPSSKAHQFVTPSNNQLDGPSWLHDLRQRRQAATNGGM